MAVRASAGIPIEMVDTVSPSHIESVGLSAIRAVDGWKPFFPTCTTIATFVGHLAVTPLHLAAGPCPAQHFEADAAWGWLTELKTIRRG